jgi:hypothetical protein
VEAVARMSSTGALKGGILTRQPGDTRRGIELRSDYKVKQIGDASITCYWDRVTADMHRLEKAAAEKYTPSRRHGRVDGGKPAVALTVNYTKIILEEGNSDLKFGITL